MIDLKTSYLSRTMLHLETKDPDGRVLKTYIDSWFAHTRGGKMLEAKGRPQWVNRGDLAKHDHLCDEAHAISLQAEARRSLGSRDDLVREHTIPKAVIVKEMKARTWSGEDELDAFLKLWFTVSIITREEHRSIRFGSTMPIVLSDELLRTDPVARFAGIRPRLRRYLFGCCHLPRSGGARQEPYPRGAACVALHTSPTSQICVKTDGL